MCRQGQASEEDPEGTGIVPSMSCFGNRRQGMSHLDTSPSAADTIKDGLPHIGEPQRSAAHTQCKVPIAQLPKRSNVVAQTVDSQIERFP